MIREILDYVKLRRWMILVDLLVLVLISTAMYIILVFVTALGG